MFFVLSAAIGASSGGAPLWPFITAIFVSLVGFAGTAYAVIIQRRVEKDKIEIEKERESEKIEESLLRTNITSQVNLTKDVLDNWKEIVQNLGRQIAQLHDQVHALEDRERTCQAELMRIRAKMYVLEGKLPKDDTDA